MSIRTPFSLFLVCLVPFSAHAESGEQKNDLSEYSLEELLRLEVTVASDRAMKARESPGILTIVTQEEIRNLGARDLIDVLRIVPGFDFGVDVLGVVGAGFRGNWAHEGKILLLVDGHPFNDRMYTNVPFGNHFPVNLIKRVEIIRGPGSAIYGGFAELAVINIVTVVAAEEEGIKVVGTSAYHADTYARQNLEIGLGNHVGDDVYVGGGAFLGFAQRGDRAFTDFAGDSYNMEGNSDLRPIHANVGFRYKTLRANFLFDDYQTTHRDGNDAVVPGGDTPNDFKSFHTGASYTHAFSDELTLTPEFRFSHQEPWKNNVLPPSDPIYYDAAVDHFGVLLKSSYRVGDNFQLVGGGEVSFDRATYAPGSSYLFPNGQQDIVYRNFAFYYESTFSAWLNMTAGMRFEKHSEFGSSFVPRIGLTKLFDPFHAKLLYSRAFRAPGIEQIRLGNDIQPETTDIVEAEFGWSATRRSILTANYYEILIDEPIVFSFDSVRSVDSYQNLDGIHTRGMEAEYRYTDSWGYALLSYSFYAPVGMVEPFYEVPGRDDVLLGLPAHKIVAHSSIKILGGLRVNPTLILTSPRYGFVTQDSNRDPVSRSLGAHIECNLYVVYRDLGIKGLDLGAGVYDIFNDAPSFVQPYNGGHAPLPAASREYLARVTYAWR